MKKLLLASVLFLSVLSQLHAQQRPQYTQYLFNNFALNPAIAGIASYTEVKTGYRRQWVGLEGAPVTYYTTFHTPIGKKDQVPVPKFQRRASKLPFSFSGRDFAKRKTARTMKNQKVRAHHGIGAIVQGDRTGPLSSTGLYAVYAYHIPLSRMVRLSMGTSAGMLQYKYTERRASNANAIDPVLASGNVAEMMPDINLGTWLYSDNFFVGVAAAQLLNSQGKFVYSDRYQGSGVLQKHYFITGGYKYGNDTWTFLPSVMLKKGRPSPMSVDVNMKAEYGSRISAGLSYRHEDGVAAMVGFRIAPMWEAAYSYDATTSGLNKVSAGTHELMLGLRFHTNANMLTCPNWLW
jgi:type IX secretion system PorP/SprF family membrane protein